VPLWREITTDPHADAILTNQALRSLTTHYLAVGEHTKAEAALAGVKAGIELDPKIVANVRRAVRRHHMHNACIAVVAGLLVLAIVSLVRAMRSGRGRVVIERTRASSRLVLAYGAYVAISGAVLAMGYEEGTSRPFLIFGLALVPLLFLARAWAAAGSPARWARIGRATLCATSALGVAFLVLEHVDVAYLEGIGL
jgi:hypothetical protein